jgi:sulfoacetaldehyde dehydrogenase
MEEAMADNLQEMMERARAAQCVIEDWPQEKVDQMVAAVGWQLYKRDHAEACARLAADETQMGVYEDKVLKHQKKTLGCLNELHGLKTVGVVEDNPVKGIKKIAKPVGVIAAVTPMTNATSTIACNGLPILKTRNAVIFAPHPRAKKSCDLTCSYMRAGLRQVGAPVDLVQNVLEPSIETTQNLMKIADLIVATGGGPMVKSAYSSGKPAYGVGAGNSIVVIDETAVVAEAAKNIMLGKTFDNATSCSSENSVVIQASQYDAMLAEFQRLGGHLCTPEEKERLRKVMWPDGSHISKDVVGQAATKIAALADIPVSDGTKFLMVIGEAIGPEDMFSGEKLSPVLTVWKYAEFDEAIQYVQRLTRFSGYGHSCGIQSQNEDHIMQLAMQAKVSRMMVNQVQPYANSGNYNNGMPWALTLGCGTWGNNITNENVHWKHFLNYTWLSYPIDPVIPDEEQLFGEHWQKFGK